jgi:Methyltransferase domain
VIAARKRVGALARRVRGPRLREDDLRAIADGSERRVELWPRFVEAAGAREVAEVGVYRGAFAVHVLERCPAIETYYMIDPWRNLPDWRKPANEPDRKFRRIFDQAMERTKPWESKRVVLRGRTTEVIDRIPDGTLDFAYIDGDHTLRGITIDLARVYPKVRVGGWIGGDDFVRSIWQHGDEYEPTLVFPYAVHFAEAVGERIYGLPFDQFLIEKRARGEHEFVDLTGRYDELDLRSQMRTGEVRSATPEP